MSRLRDCLDKLEGKLISREDARYIEQKAAQYEADGDKPIVAARAAVNEMISSTQAAGEHVLEQIGAQKPDAHQAAIDFWNRETLRKAQPLKAKLRVEAPAAMPPVTPPVAPAVTPVAEAPAAPPAEAPAEAPPAAPPPLPAEPAAPPAAPPVAPKPKTIEELLSLFAARLRNLPVRLRNW